MDLSIPYLITSSALILFDLFTHKSQSHVSPVIESTESYLSSSRVTILSDGTIDGNDVWAIDKSRTGILAPPIDHPMNDYKDRLVNIWSREYLDGEYEFIATGLCVDAYVWRGGTGIDYYVVAVLVKGKVYNFPAEHVDTDDDGLTVWDTDGLVY